MENVVMVTPTEATGHVRMTLRQRSGGEVATPIASKLSQRADCDVKNLMCLKCSTQYSSLKTLQFHMASLHSERRTFYTCLFCDMVFVQLWGVTRHMMRTHKKTKEQVEKLRETLRRRCFSKSVDELGPNGSPWPEGNTPTRVSSIRAQVTRSPQMQVAPPTRMPSTRSHGTRSQQPIVRAGLGKDPVPSSSSSPIRINQIKELTRPTYQRHSCEKCGKEFRRKENLERHFSYCSTSSETMEVKSERHLPFRSDDSDSRQDNKRFRPDPDVSQEQPILPVTISDNYEAEQREKEISRLHTSVQNETEERGKEISQLHESVQNEMDNYTLEERQKEISRLNECVPNEMDNYTMEERQKEISQLHESVQNETDNGLQCQRVEVDIDGFKQQDVKRIDSMVDAERMICLKCNRRYGSISNLRRHAVRHMGWRRYKCKLCKFTSYNRSEVKSHLHRSHATKVMGNHEMANYVTDLEGELTPSPKKKGKRKGLKIPPAASRTSSRVSSSSSSRSSGHSQGSSSRGTDRRKPAVDVANITHRDLNNFNISTRKTRRTFDTTPYRQVDKMSMLFTRSGHYRKPVLPKQSKEEEEGDEDDDDEDYDMDIAEASRNEENDKDDDVDEDEEEEDMEDDENDDAKDMLQGMPIDDKAEKVKVATDSEAAGVKVMTSSGDLDTEGMPILCAAVMDDTTEQNTTSSSCSDLTPLAQDPPALIEDAPPSLEKMVSRTQSSKSEIPNSSKSEIPNSSKSAIPNSSKSAIPNSSKSEIPNSSKSEIPNSSKSEIPNSSKSEISNSSKSEASSCSLNTGIEGTSADPVAEATSSRDGHEDLAHQQLIQDSTVFKPGTSKQEESTAQESGSDDQGMAGHDLPDSVAPDDSVDVTKTESTVPRTGHKLSGTPASGIISDAETSVFESKSTTSKTQSSVSETKVSMSESEFEPQSTTSKIQSTALETKEIMSESQFEPQSTTSKIQSTASETKEIMSESQFEPQSTTSKIQSTVSETKVMMSESEFELQSTASKITSTVLETEVTMSEFETQSTTSKIQSTALENKVTVSESQVVPQSTTSKIQSTASEPMISESESEFEPQSTTSKIQSTASETEVTMSEFEPNSTTSEPNISESGSDISGTKAVLSKTQSAPTNTVPLFSETNSTRPGRDTSLLLETKPSATMIVKYSPETKTLTQEAEGMDSEMTSNITETVSTASDVESSQIGTRTSISGYSLSQESIALLDQRPVTSISDAMETSPPSSDVQVSMMTEHVESDVHASVSETEDAGSAMEVEEARGAVHDILDMIEGGATVCPDLLDDIHEEQTMQLDSEVQQ